MFKNAILTSAAALAITLGASAINTPQANAGVSVNLSFGGLAHFGGYYGGFYGGYYCAPRRVLVKFWHVRHRHMHKRWVWRTYC